MVSILLGGLSTRAQWEDVKNFFKEEDTERYNVYLAQSLDMIWSKAVWVERDSENLEVWLNENGYGNAEGTYAQGKYFELFAMNQRIDFY